MKGFGEDGVVIEGSAFGGGNKNDSINFDDENFGQAPTGRDPEVDQILGALNDSDAALFSPNDNIPSSNNPLDIAVDEGLDDYNPNEKEVDPYLDGIENDKAIEQSADQVNFMMEF